MRSTWDSLQIPGGQISPNVSSPASHGLVACIDSKQGRQEAKEENRYRRDQRSDFEDRGEYQCEEVSSAGREFSRRECDMLDDPHSFDGEFAYMPAGSKGPELPRLPTAAQPQTVGQINLVCVTLCRAVRKGY